MNKYFELRALLIGFMVAMLIIGYAAIPLPGNEIFPFYAWSMFSKVPSQENIYTVFILEVKGRVLNPPVEFQLAGGVVGNPNSVEAYRNIQKLGLAFDAKKDQEVQTWRTLFERNYLGAGTRYELSRTNFDPLTRWRTGGRTCEDLQSWTTAN